MATEQYWSEPPIDRRNTPLGRIFPTLDAVIAPDDPVRLFDEVLQQVDWALWEVEYKRERGQPPIPPRDMAAVILYGLYRGIRSTRKLEEACNYRLDFMWLVNGRRIDYSTIAKFRTRFRDPLKDLFKQVGRLAMSLGLIRLGEVAFDATRIRAGNSRFETRTAETLESKLAALDELFEHLMTQMKDDDGLGAGPSQLPDALADVQRRRAQVEKALEQARAADEARRNNGVDPARNPAQIPTTDPDSRVMPNKEGGYAPNYNPIVTTDGEHGFILDCDVLNEVNEGPAAAASVDRIAETFGQLPEKFLTDSGNNSGQIIARMEARGVEFYAPVDASQPAADSPVLRNDPTQPVPESEWDRLKRNSQGKLDKSCFVYDAEADLYYCPLGEEMPYAETKKETRGGEQVAKRVYRCAACAGCPLAAACLGAKNKRGRTIGRDTFAEARERVAARMASAAGRTVYERRMWMAETPFAIIKQVLGLRQFLLRGLEKVKMEWCWATTAYNIMKLVRLTEKLRAETAKAATAS